MLFKLALGNVRKSYRDYGVYFTTLASVVAMFYMFNSIEDQASQLTRTGNSLLKGMSQLTFAISILMILVLVTEVVYANNFLIKRRSKELGIYLTLGMSRANVMGILFIETALMSTLSLGVGIVAGVLGTQFMMFATAKLFGLSLQNYQFVFSKFAFMVTTISFILVFAVVSVLNLFRVARLQLIHLLYAGRHNEKMAQRDSSQNALVFLLALALLGGAYYSILKSAFVPINPLFWLSIALGIPGTLLLFNSFSYFALKTAQKNPRFYYSGLRMFTFRQLASKMKSTHRFLAVMSMVLLISFGAFGTGNAAAEATKSVNTRFTPYPYMLFYNSLKTPTAEGELEQDLLAGIEKEKYFSGFSLQRFYYVMDARDFIPPAEMKPHFGPFVTEFMWHGSQMTALDQSAVRKTAALLGKEYPAVQPGTAVLNLDQNVPVTDNLKKLVTGKKVQINGQTLTVADISSVTLMNQGRPGMELTFVVSDEVLKTAGRPHFTTFNAIPRSDADMAQLALLLQKVTDRQPELGKYHFTSEQAKYVGETQAVAAMALYVTIFIGLLFLVVAASLLSLQQLSESQDNASRYWLLQKLGVQKTQMRKALLGQIATYFWLPLVVGAVHTMVGISAAQNVIAIIGDFKAVNAVAPIVVVVSLYFFYMLLTYRNARRIVEEKQMD